MSTHAAAFPPMHAPAPPPREWRPRPYVQGYVLFLLLCQVALLIPGLGPLRLAVRMAAFGGGLALLALLRGRGRRHPAAAVGFLALLDVGLAAFNPNTPTLMAGVAQAALYTAVMAPLFWVPRLTVDLRVLRRTVMILWAFHTLSAGLGVLQVYRPGFLQPPLSAVVASKGQGYVESLKFTTATGERVFRPMGLTDVPGGAGISGLYAVLFGIGFFLTRRTPGMITASLLSMGVGVMCLYLSQVRALVVMTGVAVIAVTGILAWRRDVGRLAALGGSVGLVAVLGYMAAISIMGPTAQRRMAVLVQNRPGTVYYSNRGHFLEEAFTGVLPRYPLGAGLGHWGMVAAYFGADVPRDPTAPSFWVEIQWAGWVVDGGAPLVVLYVGSVLVALWMAWRIARAPPPGAPDLPFWAAIVLAHGIGAMALTFSYPIFVAQSGLEFWLLNATLFAAARHAREAAALGAGAGTA